MASSLALSTPRLLTAEEFFQIDFGPDLKAELDNGVIRMMAGGSRDHARVQANILAFLHGTLRGSPCRAYGSDMAVHDLLVKKAEYREIETLDTIVFVDPEAGLVSVSQRSVDLWTDTPFAAVDVPIPSLGIVAPIDDILA